VIFMSFREDLKTIQRNVLRTIDEDEKEGIK